MSGNQLAQARFHHRIRTLAVLVDAALVLKIGRAVHRYGDAHRIVRKELDDFVGQQRGVGRQAVGHALAFGGSGLIGIKHHIAQQLEVHQRFTAEERDVRHFAVTRAGQQEIDRCLGGFQRHVFGLARRRGDLVCAEFIAIGTSQIALVGDVQHKGLQRIVFGRRRRGQRRFADFVRDDTAHCTQFADQVFGIGARIVRFDQRRNHLAIGHFLLAEQRHDAGRTFIKGEDGTSRGQVHKALALGIEQVDVTAAVFGGENGCHLATSG